MGTDTLIEWSPILMDLEKRTLKSHNVEVQCYSISSTLAATATNQNEQGPIFEFPTPDLTSENKKKLLDVLSQYTDIFSKDEFDIGSCPIVAPPIELTTTEPIAAKPYRVPEKMKGVINEFICKLLAAGIIIKSTTAWTSL
uniref:Reverse transcriptase domain-containing protein n=1 Tax=Panagrolaimus superbus TaxID=310955 RepID=A0A914Y3Y1_9BILA